MTRLRVTLKNLDTDRNFEIDGIDLIKQNKDWIEVNFNVPKNDYFKPYLYQRTQYEIISVVPYEM